MTEKGTAILTSDCIDTAWVQEAAHLAMLEGYGPTTIYQRLRLQSCLQLCATLSRQSYTDQGKTVSQPLVVELVMVSTSC